MDPIKDIRYHWLYEHRKPAKYQIVTGYLANRKRSFTADVVYTGTTQEVWERYENLSRHRLKRSGTTVVFKAANMRKWGRIV